MSVQRVLSLADLEAAPWVACGQAALAAVLQRSLGDVRAVCPDHTWMSVRDLRIAVTKLGLRWRPTALAHVPGLPKDTKRWPFRGFAQIQLTGPWEAPGIPLAAALERSHWVGVRPLANTRPRTRNARLLFDLNALGFDVEPGAGPGWLSQGLWEEQVLPALLARHRTATGGWWIRAGLELDPPAEPPRAPPAPPRRAAEPVLPGIPLRPGTARHAVAVPPLDLRERIRTILAAPCHGPGGIPLLWTREGVATHPSLRGILRRHIEAELTGMVLVDGELEERAGGQLVPSSSPGSPVVVPRPGAQGGRR